MICGSRAPLWLVAALLGATSAAALRLQELSGSGSSATAWADRAAGRADSTRTSSARSTRHQSDGVPGKASAQLPGEGGKFAVVISGLRSRLVLNSTLERVVRPAARLGYEVHVYMSLVEKGDGAAFTSHGLSDPELAEKGSDEFRQHLESAIAAAGGSLVHYVDHDAQELLDPLPADAVHREYMYDYTPSESAFGMNVLRRWKSSEELLNQTLLSGVGYDFLLWEREDQYWLSPLWLYNFRRGTESANVVYAKNCLGWGGINDKSLLMGRDAAKKLMTAYSSFWKRDVRLRSRNAEQFLDALAGLQGLSVHRVPFAVLPSADATFAQSGSSRAPSLCIKEFYSCKSTLPKGSPDFCPVTK